MQILNLILIFIHLTIFNFGLVLCRHRLGGDYENSVIAKHALKARFIEICRSPSKQRKLPRYTNSTHEILIFNKTTGNQLI